MSIHNIFILHSLFKKKKIKSPSVSSWISNKPKINFYTQLGTKMCDLRNNLRKMYSL